MQKRRWIALAGCLALLALVGAAAAGAGASSAPRAVHLQNAIDESESFQSAFLSEQCGFDVTITISRAIDVTLIYNEAGLVVREIDTTPAGTVRFSSAYGSFSFPSALTGIFTYPGGATVGSTANIRLTGLSGHVPGLTASNAGIEIVVNAIVVGISPEGIPDVEATEETSFITHGNSVSGEDFVSAVCAALGPA
jgi:hypothetical protein